MVRNLLNYFTNIQERREAMVGQGGEGERKGTADRRLGRGIWVSSPGKSFAATPFRSI